MNPVPPNPDQEPVCPVTVTPNQERSADYARFLKYVSEKTGTISYTQLAVLYPALCQAAMEYLIAERRPVDMGFLVLHPCPHRANWKQIMLAQFPQLGPTLLGESAAVKEAMLDGTGAANKMLNGEMLAVCGERVIVWGVEVELKRSYWRAMLKYEYAKYRHLGSIGYAAYIARVIVALRPKIFRIYLSYLRQIAYPCARIKQSRVHRRGFIIPFVPRGKARPVSIEDIPVDFVVPRAPEQVAVPPLFEVVLPDAGVPQVSNIPDGPQDLRFTAERPPG